MAKKSTFNMSAEVRALLERNNDLTGPEMYETLSKKFRGRKLNKNSCGVSYSKARKIMGLTLKKKRGKSISRKVPKPAAATATVSLAALKSAAELLSHTDGDVGVATAILREVRALQE